MKAAEILAILTEANKELNDNNVRYINNGGCGIFAERFYRILFKLGKKAKIVILTTRVDLYYKQFITDKYYYNVCNHVIVKIGRCYYDSDGKFDLSTKFTYCDKIEDVPIMVLRKFIERTSWNSMFNKEHITEIEKTLEKVYEKYVNNLVVSNI